MKVCKQCKAEKPLTAFHKASNHVDGYRNECKECRKLYSSKHYELNSIRIKQRNMSQKERRRNNHLRSKYGIDIDTYNKILANQGGVCAICEGGISTKSAAHFDVDHDHETTIIRGILCRECNTGLGKFKNSRILLTKAIDYLQWFETAAVKVISEQYKQEFGSRL